MKKFKNVIGSGICIVLVVLLFSCAESDSITVKKEHLMLIHKNAWGQGMAAGAMYINDLEKIGLSATDTMINTYVKDSAEFANIVY